MATGLLGYGELSQSAAEVLYTPGASTKGVVTVSICNKGASSIRARLGVSGSATTSVTAYLEFDTLLEGNGVLERTGLTVTNPQTLIAEVGTASAVDYVVLGIEETAG